MPATTTPAAHIENFFLSFMPLAWLSGVLFSAKYRIQLYKIASTMLRNKLTLLQVLETFKTLEAGDGGFASSLRIRSIDKWIKDVKDGRNIGISMGPVLTSSERLLIASGVQTSKLAEAFEACRFLIKGQIRMRANILEKSAMPVVLILTIIAIVYVCVWLVLPAFSDIIPRDKWIGAAAIFADVTTALESNIGIIGFGLLALSILIGWSLPNWANGRLRVIFDRYPPWGIYKTQLSSTFMLTISSIEATGTRIDSSVLGELAFYSSPWQATRIRAIGTFLDDGKNLGQAMILAGHEYPDRRVPHLLKVFYELDKPEEALRDLAHEQLEWAEESVKHSMGIFNAFALVLVTIIITSMGYSIFTLMLMIGGQSF